MKLKVDKLLARLVRKREKLQIVSIMNEKGDITIDSSNIKRI